MEILETLGFFVPTLLASLGITLVFAWLLKSHFGETKDARFTKFGRGAAYFAVFSIFGLVVAFFLSLGITESNGVRTNALVGTFATPLIALLTAGVSYFASKGAPSPGANPPLATGVVPAGVTCFLLGACLCYKSFSLAIAHQGV